MSGSIEECGCGGEVWLRAVQSGKYTIRVGICPNCGCGVSRVPDEAYNDEEWQDDGSWFTSLMEERGRLQEDSIPLIVDSPEFQIKQKCQPCEGSCLCHTCEHSYVEVVDGRKGDRKCRHGKTKGFDEDCDLYAPCREWAGMGLHCKWCLNAGYVADGKSRSYKCTKHDPKSMTAYEREHCADYQNAPYDKWWFERRVEDALRTLRSRGGGILHGVVRPSLQGA